jgi:aquaporin NIP
LILLRCIFFFFFSQIGAEVISTFILVFSGCGAAMADAKSHGEVTHVGVSLAFGLVIMIMIQAVGHISGAHMNPAITIAFATMQHFPWIQVQLPLHHLL